MGDKDKRSRDEGRQAPREIRLPGGGVLRLDALREELEGAPVTFADIVEPFVLVGLVALGVIPHPDSGRAEPDRARARSAIETLELLREKTEGRLDPGEARVLDQALAELRLQLSALEDREESG